MTFFLACSKFVCFLIFCSTLYHSQRFFPRHPLCMILSVTDVAQHLLQSVFSLCSTSFQFTFPGHQTNWLALILTVICTLHFFWGGGTPRGCWGNLFRLCSSLVHSLPHLLLCFTFFLFSFTLLIFSHPFLPESSHSVSRREVVGGDRTWV